MISRSLVAFAFLLLGVVLTFAVQSHAAEASVNVEDPYGGGKPPKPMPQPKPKPMKPKPMHPMKAPTKPKMTPKPAPKPSMPKHMGSTGVNSGKGKQTPTVMDGPILPGVPTPLPHVNPRRKSPEPVEGIWEDWVGADDTDIPAPSASTSSSSSSSASDSSVMNTVQSQSNTKVSVGSYSGVPGGFYTTKTFALVYQGKMDTDCDGAPSCPSIDKYGQTSTSFSYQGKAIDALKVNYVVLPSDLSRKLGSKIKLGDIVAVGYQGKVSYAIYADNGPLGKAGEGSVHLTQELGFNPYCGSQICRGISSGVSYVVFPGSRGRYVSPYDSATIAAAGKALLRQQVN